MKEQVSEKKCRKVKGDFFMAGICKNVYGKDAIKDKSTCRAVKCNACMLIGDGFPEDSISSEQAQLDNDGERNVGTRSSRNRSKRTQKKNMTSSSTVVKRYLMDDNGCCHDDPCHWNEERDMRYWQDKWRRTFYVKSSKGFELDYLCFTCKKNVTEGFL